MLRIGIIGGNSPCMARILENLYQSAGASTPSVKCLSKCVKDCANSTGNTIEQFDIIIINANGPLAEKHLSQLRSSGMLIINSDDKNIFKYLIPINNKLITYGLNGKACVTASSVIDGEYSTVQCCVQRNIPTFKNSSVCEQEFSVDAKTGEADIYSILGAVTAMLIDGVPVEHIKSTSFKTR